MVDTLSVLPVVAVFFLTVLAPAHGQSGTCVFMERCREDFQEKAMAAGNDRNHYCELQRLELQCFHDVVSKCPEALKPFAQKQIENAQAQQTAACDATSILPSIAAICVTALGLLFRHLL